MDVVPAITREEIHELIGLHDRLRMEAARCADASAFTAGCVMLAAALEAQLICTIRMGEHVLRPAGLWPNQPSDRWSFGTALGVAKKAGWLRSPLGDIASAINDVRVCCVHPAAYLRDGGAPVKEREFAAMFNVLLAADEALARVISTLPDPPHPT